MDWLEGLRAACRARHLSLRTEAAYAHWVGRYLRFQGADRTASPTAADAQRYLDDLVLRGEVAAGSHLLALNALLFLFRHVMWVEDVTALEARRRQVHLPERLSEVLSVAEVRMTLNAMRGLPRLVAALVSGHHDDRHACRAGGANHGESAGLLLKRSFSARDRCAGWPWARCRVPARPG